MKNLWKGAVALVFLGSIVAATGPGCVDNESSIFIRNVAAPSCDLLTVDSPEILIGKLDTRYSCSYSEVLVVGNQLVRRGDDNKLQTETSRIEIKSVDVQILDPDGAVVGEFSTPATGFIDPATNTAPGYGLTEVPLIDGATGKFLNDNGIQLVTSRVVLHGRTLGGQDVQTTTWDFPIEVCNGCLCKEPADDTCINPDSTPTEKCWIKKDFDFDCRLIGAPVDCSFQDTCGAHLP